MMNRNMKTIPLQAGQVVVVSSCICTAAPLLLQPERDEGRGWYGSYIIWICDIEQPFLLEGWRGRWA